MVMMPGEVLPCCFLVEGMVPCPWQTGQGRRICLDLVPWERMVMGGGGGGGRGRGGCEWLWWRGLGRFCLVCMRPLPAHLKQGAVVAKLGVMVVVVLMEEEGRGEGGIGVMVFFFGVCV